MMLRKASVCVRSPGRLKACPTWCRKLLIHGGGARAFASEPVGMGLLIQAASVCLAFSLAILAEDPTNSQVHFTVTAQYLQKLAAQNKFQVTLDLTPLAMTKRVHPLKSDCEMHLVTKSKAALGQPKWVVVEPPNLCKFDAPEDNWPSTLHRLLDTNCKVTGFPRLFTEHARGKAEPANPNHFLEVHPASAITCGKTELDFAEQLTYFAGMSHILPSTAANCLAARKLWMRKKADTVQFHQEPLGGCGNFAIVQVKSIEPGSVQEVDDGYFATASVTADGQRMATLRIYALAGSDAETWLAYVKTNGLGNKRVYLHGMLSYDTPAIARQYASRVAKSSGGWQAVDSPLALVIFGFPKSAPWK